MTDETVPQETLDKLAGKFGFPSREQEIKELAEESPATQPEVAGDEVETVDDGMEDLIWDGSSLGRHPKALVELVNKAASMDGDYTRGKQEVAERRRALEQAQSLAEAHRMEASFNAA